MPPEPGDRLDSWKEIAAYAKRSVRTVRRWERDEGLPVHRHVHRSLARGFALAGMPDRALHWLGVAVDRGFVHHPFLARLDPCFRGLRRNRRFVELMAVVRGRWEQFEE